MLDAALCVVWIRTPEEQMRQDDASRLESALSGKPASHEHFEYGLGQKMALVEQLGKLLLRGGYRHVRQVFDSDGNGIVANANAALVGAANRQILKQGTDEDTQLLQQLQQIKEQLKAPDKQSTIIEIAPHHACDSSSPLWPYVRSEPRLPRLRAVFTASAAKVGLQPLHFQRPDCQCGQMACSHVFRWSVCVLLIPFRLGMR